MIMTFAKRSVFLSPVRAIRAPRAVGVTALLSCLCLVLAAVGHAQPRRARRIPPPAAKAAAGAKAASDKAAGDKAAANPGAKDDAAVPGEAEFNSCLKIPARRRIKVTLKQESELKDLVAWISSMTCKRFIIASNIRSQKVTLISPRAITAAEAYRAFLSSLEAMGLSVVPAGQYLKVVQGNWAIQGPIPTYTAAEGRRVPATDDVVTHMVRVENVDVNQLLLVLNKMKSRSGDVTAYKPTNMLIITDRGLNIRRMLTVIGELDVPVTGDKIWIYRLRHADVDEVKKILDQAFATRGASIPRVVAKVKAPPTPPGKGAVRGTAVSNVVPEASKIVADPSTNSLIILASAASFRRISSLIKRIDIESSASASQRIHVYYLENGDADQMAQTLASLTTGGTVARRPTPGRARGAVPARAAQSATLFEGDVRVSADKATNSLVIIASTRDYLSLRRVVRKLDIPRRQVFVEATILEVDLNNNRRLGVSYHGGGTVGSGDDQSLIFGGVQQPGLSSLLPPDPLSLMGLAVGARGPEIQNSGDLLGVNFDIAGFGVMLQALQTNNNVNVLSSPHILTTDNEEAEIVVGQNLPFLGAVTAGLPTGQGGASFTPLQSIQRQDVALKLKLTPHVNESDMVRLEVEQEVSDIVAENFNNAGPATSKRTAKTTVVVRDEQSVVLGGLMRETERDEISKVPLLGDIPILGYLFKRKAKAKRKTNLLIVLTPHVIRDQTDLRRIFEKKLRERREFIRRYSSFNPREPGQDIDYRHKGGLLGQIDRVGAKAEAEARLIREAEAVTAADTEQPIEVPRLGPAQPDGGTEPGVTGVGGEPPVPGQRRK
ncbi:MAG: type II secretion system secretin GspD [Deltaproteobacteria bacterium]|nr:type II secretion system secretin GspD [Deltaproteobacteria bacterium]